jgi:hypothetical protein
VRSAVGSGSLSGVDPCRGEFLWDVEPYRVGASPGADFAVLVGRLGSRFSALFVEADSVQDPTISTDSEPSATARAPKLLGQVRQAVRLRHVSRRTEESHVAWIRRYIRFHALRHPRELGAADVTRFLASLAEAGRLSASSQTQALSALWFLYKEVLHRSSSRSCRSRARSSRCGCRSSWIGTRSGCCWRVS